MNDRFKIISDLVADAEDLVDKVAAAEAPEVRALAGRLRHSVDCMEEHLRERLRAATEQPSFTSDTRTRALPWVYYISAAMALGLMGWLYARYRNER